jgi:predicted GTPase
MDYDEEDNICVFEESEYDYIAEILKDLLVYRGQQDDTLQDFITALNNGADIVVVEDEPSDDDRFMFF